MLIGSKLRAAGAPTSSWELIWAASWRAASRSVVFDPRDGLPRFEELFQRIHPDDQPKIKELMQREVREKIEFETDYRLVHPGGAVRDIHATAHPVFSQAGDLVEFMGTVIDVTEPEPRVLREGPGRHAVRATSSVWADGYQERSEPEASEFVHGTPSNTTNRALHCRGGAYAAGAAGGVAGCLRS